MATVKWGAAPLAAALAVGCASSVGIGPTALPQIGPAVVEPNPEMVVAADVRVTVADAESVAVRYRIVGQAEAQLTPAVIPIGDSALVPVLGLQPERGYRLEVVAWGGGASTQGPGLDFMTDSLPGDLPRYQASGADPAPGFVIFTSGRYALAIDNGGRVVWYRRFPDGAGLNFMALPTGGYALRPITAASGDDEPWVWLDPRGAQIGTFGCGRGLRSRPHDLIGEPDGGYWILCDETRQLDLGGASDVAVTGTVVQHLDASGVIRFEWSAFDWFDLADVDSSARGGPTLNWTHGNALDLRGDLLIVSFRNLNEITGIEVPSGRIRWRLGGARNQFARSLPGPPFRGQHGARLLGAGEIVLLDNLGEAGGSRAERYALDAARDSASLLRSYEPTDLVVAQVGGTTQPLPGGHLLVSYGSGSRVEEYDAEGRSVWRLDGNPGYVFRAQRIGSLYAPGVEASPAALDRRRIVRRVASP